MFMLNFIFHGGSICGSALIILLRLILYFSVCLKMLCMYLDVRFSWFLSTRAAYRKVSFVLLNLGGNSLAKFLKLSMGLDRKTLVLYFSTKG